MKSMGVGSAGRLPAHLEQAMRFQEERTRELPPKKSIPTKKPTSIVETLQSTLPTVRHSVSASSLPSPSTTIVTHLQIENAIDDSSLSLNGQKSAFTNPSNIVTKSQNSQSMLKEKAVQDQQITSDNVIVKTEKKKEKLIKSPDSKPTKDVGTHTTAERITSKLNHPSSNSSPAVIDSSKDINISPTKATDQATFLEQKQVQKPNKKSETFTSEHSNHVVEVPKKKIKIDQQVSVKKDGNQSPAKKKEMQNGSVEAISILQPLPNDVKVPNSKDMMNDEFFLSDETEYNPKKRERIAMLSQLYGDSTQNNENQVVKSIDPLPAVPLPSIVDDIINKQKVKDEKKRAIQDHHQNLKNKDQLKVHTENMHYVSHLQHKAAAISGAPSSSTVARKESFGIASTDTGSDENESASIKLKDVSNAKRLLDGNVQLAKHMEEVQLQLLQESNTISSLMNRIVEQHEALKELNTNVLYHRKELGTKVEEINNNYIQLFEEMLREVMKVQRVKFKSQTKLVEDLKKVNDRLSGELHLRLDDIHHLEEEKKEILLEKNIMEQGFDKERLDFQKSLAKLQQECEFRIQETNNFNNYKLEENEMKLRKELNKKFTNELKEQVKLKEIQYQSQINQLAIDVQKRQQEITHLKELNADLQEKLEKVLAGKGILDTKALFKNMDKINFKHPSVDISTQTVIDFQEEGLWDKQNGWMLPISKNALVRSRWRKAFNYARCPSCRGSGQYVSQIAALMRQCVSGGVATNVADTIRTGKKAKQDAYRKSAISKSPSAEVSESIDQNEDVTVNDQSAADNVGIASMTPNKSVMFTELTVEADVSHVTPPPISHKKVKKLHNISNSQSGSASSMTSPRSLKKASKLASASAKQQQLQQQLILASRSNDPYLLVSHISDTIDEENIPAEEQYETEYQSVLLISRDQLKDIDMANCLVENSSFFNHYLQYSKIVIPDDLMQFLSNLPHSIQAIPTQSLAWCVAMTYSILEHKILADRDDRWYNFPRQSMSLYMISHMLQYIPYNRIYSEYMIYIYMKTMRSFYKQSDLLCIIMRSIGMLDEYTIREKQLLDDWKKSGEKALQKKRAKAAEALSVRERSVGKTASVSTSSKITTSGSKSTKTTGAVVTTKKEKEKTGIAEKSYVGMSIYDEEYRITSHTIALDITEVLLFTRSCLHANNYQGVYKVEIDTVKQSNSVIFEAFEKFVNGKLQRSLWQSIVIAPGVHAKAPDGEDHHVEFDEEDDTGNVRFHGFHESGGSHLKLKPIHLPSHVLCPIYSPSVAKQQPLAGYNPYHFYIPLDRAVRVMAAMIQHVINPKIFCPIIDSNVINQPFMLSEEGEVLEEVEGGKKSVLKKGNILTEESIMKIYRSMEEKTLCLYPDGTMSLPEGLHSFIRSTMRLFICSPTANASDLNDWRVIGEMYLKDNAEKSSDGSPSINDVPQKAVDPPSAAVGPTPKNANPSGKKPNKLLDGVNPAFAPPDIDIDYQIQLDTILNDVDKYTLLIDSDHVQLLIVELLRKRMTYIDNCLIAYFEQGDLNHDHVLNFMEFEGIIKTINPTCPERQIIRMFREALSMGNDNDCIGPNGFVEVCKKFKIVDLVDLQELQQNGLSALAFDSINKSFHRSQLNLHQPLNYPTQGDTHDTHYPHSSRLSSSVPVSKPVTARTHVDIPKSIDTSRTHVVDTPIKESAHNPKKEKTTSNAKVLPSPHHDKDKSIGSDHSKRQKVKDTGKPKTKVDHHHSETEDSEIEEHIAPPVPAAKEVPVSTQQPAPVVYMTKKKEVANNRRMLPLSKVDLTQRDGTQQQETALPKPLTPVPIPEQPTTKDDPALQPAPIPRRKVPKVPKMEINEELSKESSVKMMKELRARKLMRIGGGQSINDDSDEDSNEDDDDD